MNTSLLKNNHAGQLTFMYTLENKGYKGGLPTVMSKKNHFSLAKIRSVNSSPFVCVKNIDFNNRNCVTLLLKE